MESDLGPCIDHGGSGRIASYARVKSGVKMLYKHRLVLEEKLGRPLNEGEVCRHLCDNRRCINPKHLIVGSIQDNVADMVERDRQNKGEDRPLAKLTDDLVRTIRGIYVPGDPDVGCNALARRFNVSAGTLSLALNNKTWRHV